MNRSSSSKPPTEGAVCRVTGDLIREDVDRSPAPDLRQWAAIESLLGKGRRGRSRDRSVARWLWRLAAPALAAGAVVTWLLLEAGSSPLTYSMEGCEIGAGDRDGAGDVITTAGEGGRIVFSDGSTIALGGNTRGRIVVPDRSSSAELVLLRGAASVYVVHRRNTRWTVEAGPFRVQVHGTRFRVQWSPEQRHFRLDLQHGEVSVSSRSLPASLTVRSGEAIEATDDEVSVQRPASQDEPAPPAAAPPAGATGVAAIGSKERTRRADVAESPARSALAVSVGVVEAPRARSAVHTSDDSGRQQVGVASTIDSLGLGVPASIVAPLAPPGSPVHIGADGKLSGPMSGYAWVAAGDGSVIDTPSPCNAHGCFKDATEQLCTRGTLPALRCMGPGTRPEACDWDAKWGAMIGMHTTSSGGPWSSAAPASISIAYRGRGERAQDQRGTYRLNAHVAGDPDSKNYCIDTYQSGQIVPASMFKTDCWTDSGETLEGFQRIDKVSLQVTPTELAVPFDYCITAIAVNGTAERPANVDGSHVAIGSNGKLGGEMTGYAWVAGGTGTSFSSPQRCNQDGCFRSTQGRLCAGGSVAPLACTGRGTPRLVCDWQANWGAMIGFYANLARGAWGSAAPSTVAVTFSGPPAVYRLVAHVAGTPDSELYCADRYQSGRAIEAPMLKSECWSDSGEALTSYQRIDKIGLHLVSAEGSIPFDLCVSDIVVR